MWTIGQMLVKAQAMSEYKLLSNFDADFWNEYKANSDDYDIYFASMYKSFVYFNQEDDETLEDATKNFTDMIERFLQANKKRFTELWRINVVPDDDSYSITENYYLEETYTGSGNVQNATITGQRTDINNTQVGEQNIENISKSAPFNNGSENVTGSTKGKTGTRNDIEQFTTGKQTNTGQQESSDSHTMVRHGAIGTMTVTDVLGKQEDFWKRTDLFYEYVFNEICKRFLIVGC